ncbi:serine/threonine-protein kinase WNK (With No Lysine)-like protein [Actinidia rufa]|uniref:Serine/threonine-protein kinase WNK (With No Lysine)-like protein n=1 Tax=Actinidia rufa TaxID=165716 RepID=A0A7J0DA40_9ERIC|nr:serine/threonine-protein kinase WNK (With No Lysine)-like protein [Actinidia rufa]
MEGGLPMLNCLLQHTLRSLCTYSDSSTSSKWVYAVFWRILPRNYPPPKWDYGGGALDCAKGNKRNWILVWEDGYCDFYECERELQEGTQKGRFGADVFFKMSHEVYSYGEGLVGKVAADNSHKWVFKDSPTENDPTFITSISWNVLIDPTIAIISVREGIIQLGSFDKIVEDLNLVISIQRKFSYIQSIPADDKPRLTGKKRLNGEKPIEPPHKALNLGYNSPQNGMAGGPQPIWPIPPLLPSMPCSLGALLSKVPPFVVPSFESHDTSPIINTNSNMSTSSSVKVGNGGGLIQLQVGDIKVEPACVLEAAQEEKPTSSNPHLVLGDGVPVELGFGH